MSTAHKSPQELMESGQGLVQSLAAKVHRGLPRRVDRDDLIAYGQIGLAEAARDFDPQRGVHFSTYAYYRIRGAIYNGLSKMNWMGRARANRYRYEQMASETIAADNESSRTPSGQPSQDDATWLRGITEQLAVVYLTSHGNEGHAPDDQSLADPATPPPSAVAAGREVAQKLHELIDSLPPEAAQLIRDTYFEGTTLQEAAKRLDISKSWASRLHAKTLRQLAKSLRLIGVGD